MEAYSTRGGNFGLTFVLLALALLLAVFFSSLVADIPSIADIPFTQHALNKHIRDSTNAVDLVNRVNTGNCKDMRVYVCPEDYTVIILCRLGNNKVGGLVIGVLGNPVVVTGYPASSRYWVKKTDTCLPPGSNLPFALP
jgi:hypothetical protein